MASALKGSAIRILARVSLTGTDLREVREVRQQSEADGRGCVVIGQGGEVSAVSGPVLGAGGLAIVQLSAAFMDG